MKEDLAGAHTSLGQTLTELGELGEAEAHYRRAMALDSKELLNKFGLVKVILDHAAVHTTDRLMEALTM